MTFKLHLNSIQGLPRSVLKHLVCFLVCYGNLPTKSSPPSPHFSHLLSSWDSFTNTFLCYPISRGLREYLPLALRDNSPSHTVVIFPVVSLWKSLARSLELLEPGFQVIPSSLLVTVSDMIMHGPKLEILELRMKS